MMTKQELLKQFKEGKIAVHVKTEEEARKIVKYLRRNGFKLLTLLFKFFQCIKTGNCCVDAGDERGLLYTTIDWYKENNYKIISADEFLGEQEEEEKESAIEIASEIARSISEIDEPKFIVTLKNKELKPTKEVIKWLREMKKIVNETEFLYDFLCGTPIKEKEVSMETLEEKKERLEKEIKEVNKKTRIIKLKDLSLEKLKEIKKMFIQEYPRNIEKEIEDFYHVNRLVGKGLREEEVDARISELEKPKFKEPNYEIGRGKAAHYYLADGYCPTSEQAEQRAKELKVYNLLKNFSDANGGAKLNGEDLLELVFGGEYASDSFQKLKEEARRRYRKELESLRGIRDEHKII